MYCWCLGYTKQVVLGNFSGDFRRDRPWLKSKIKRLLLNGSIILAEEVEPLFLVRSEYDFKKNEYSKYPEYATIKIDEANAIKIADELSQDRP